MDDHDPVPLSSDAGAIPSELGGAVAAGEPPPQPKRPPPEPRPGDLPGEDVYSPPPAPPPSDPRPRTAG